MYKRMVLLSLGWKTRDPYEQGVQRALHAYHGTMFGSVFLVLAFFYGVGFALTESIINAWYFLFLPALANVPLMLLLALHVLFFALLITGIFTVFFFFTGGNILHASMMTTLCVTTGLWALSKFIQKRISKELFLRDIGAAFNEDPMLTRQVETMSRRNNIRPLTVYLRNMQWSAHVIAVGPYPHICVSADLRKKISGSTMLGVLGHELGHLVIPLGKNMFLFFQEYIFMLGDLLTGFFEDKGEEKMFHAHERSRDGERAQMKKELFQGECLLKMALICSWFSSYPASQRREYVADACSALILRDAVPLINLYTILREPTGTSMISSTHPPHKQRGDCLRKIEAHAAHTRP